MRYREIILEARPLVVSINDYGRSLSVEVFVNPSKRDMQKFRGKSLRGIVTRDSLYVWDAFVATHNDIESHLKLYGLYFLTTENDDRHTVGSLSSGNPFDYANDEWMRFPAVVKAWGEVPVIDILQDRYGAK
jgi:hypothetical protein